MQTAVLPGPRSQASQGDVLAYILSPTTPDEFLTSFFEKAPLHVARDDAGYFGDVYDVAEVENSISVAGSDHERFLLVKSGAPPVLPENMTIERRHPRTRHTGRPPTMALDFRSVLSYFDRGYTFVIKDAAPVSPRLQKFLNRLQQRIGFYVQANVYFTPPKAKGFDVHHDTHDTLVMQISGTKTWRIYEPVVELPVETQPFTKDRHAKGLRLHSEVKMSPGDTLYVPHGFPHEAFSADDTSLHVTLALCPLRAIDLLEAMLDLATVTDVELRRSLPPGWHESKDFAEQFAALIRQRLPMAIRPALVLPASEMILREMFAATRTEAGGAFEEWQRFSELHSDNMLSLRDDVPYLIRQDGDRVEILIAGKSLGFPANHNAVLERLQRGPATIPELDKLLPSNLARALVKMLMLEGLITVS